MQGDADEEGGDGEELDDEEGFEEEEFGDEDE
jgi:hypothetical protein